MIVVFLMIVIRFIYVTKIQGYPIRYCTGRFINFIVCIILS